MLKCAKTQNLMSVLGMDHIFAPHGDPKTHQKSIKNRSQEGSMLSSFFNTSKNRSLSVSEALLENFVNKNFQFEPQVGSQRSTLQQW